MLKVQYLSTEGGVSCSEGVLSLLVELLGSSSEEVAMAALRLTRSLMLKYDWRVPFATEGGVRALLSCMHQFSSAPHVQQAGLAVSPPRCPPPSLGLITIAVFQYPYFHEYT